MIIPSSKGLIALDIDGTLTAETDIPREMVKYLSSIHEQGWLFAFITGRPFDWAYRTMQSIPFPSLFAIQNGALLLELPSKKILNRYYLCKSLIPGLESISNELQTDFVICSGYENKDICYYRSGFFRKSVLSYMLERAEYLQEKWVMISSFDHLPVNEFTSFKSFTDESKANLLSLQIEKELGLHSPPIKDPFRSGYFIVQATHPMACKGKVVQDILKSTSFQGPVIAAGNDNNDFGMLESASIKIAMADAPLRLLAIADIIAPPASEMGLIQGLTQALNLNRV